MKLNNKYSSYIFYTTIFLSLTILNYISNWWVFRVSGSKDVKIRETSIFPDLQAILSFIPCYKEIGNSVYLFDEISPCHKGYIYGSPLLFFLEKFKLEALPITFLGTFITISFCLGLGFLASKVSIKQNKYALFIVFILFSPGILLLIERANFDILIFLMLLVGTQLFSKKLEISGILVIAISAVIKFYTLPVLIFLLFITTQKSTKIVGFFIVLIVIPKVFLDITSITNPGFPSNWYISFGVDSFGLYLNLFLEQINQNKFILNSLEVKILGYMTLFVALILFFKFYKMRMSNCSGFLKISSDFAELNFLKITFWIFGVTFISCYLAGMSYDYRLTFLAAAGLSFIALAKYQEIKINGLTWIFSIALWCSGSFLPSTSLLLSGIIQLIGDIAIFILSALFILVLIDLITSKLHSKK